MRNYGQHNALLAGIFNARQEVIVTLDDDFQTPPSEIPKLLNKLDEGFDLVYGARGKEQHGLARNLASWMTKWALQHTLRARLALSITSFRAFRTDPTRDYPRNGPPAVFIDALLDWTAQKVTSAPVEHRPLGSGKSNYSWSKLTRHAVNMITSLSVVPLQLAVLLGFLSTFFGLCLFVFVLASVLPAREQSSWFHFPCGHHPLVLGRPALRARHHRRVSFADLFAPSRETCVRNQGNPLNVQAFASLRFLISLTNCTRCEIGCPCECIQDASPTVWTPSAQFLRNAICSLFMIPAYRESTRTFAARRSRRRSQRKSSHGRNSIWRGKFQ